MIVHYLVIFAIEHQNVIDTNFFQLQWYLNINHLEYKFVLTFLNLDNFYNYLMHIQLRIHCVVLDNHMLIIITIINTKHNFYFFYYHYVTWHTHFWLCYYRKTKKRSIYYTYMTKQTITNILLVAEGYHRAVMHFYNLLKILKLKYWKKKNTKTGLKRVTYLGDVQIYLVVYHG